MSAHVAGSRPCVQAVVEQSALEAAVVEAADGIDYLSDLVNPPPR